VEGLNNQTLFSPFFISENSEKHVLKHKINIFAELNTKPRSEYEKKTLHNFKE